MGKKVKGSVSGAVSGNKTVEEKKKKLGKKKKEPSTLDSQQKNVRFDCNSEEKDHVKYVTTPFLSSVKKDKGKASKSEEKVKNKKKLTFDEENTSGAKKLPKKRKLDSDENKSTDNKTVKESSDVVTKKKKSKTEPANPEKTSEATMKSVTSNESPEANVNEKHLTIFVGNLPLTYDHKKIVKLFNKFGPIQSARIRSVPVASAVVPKRTTAITKKFNPKRNSANGYVVFKSKDSVEKAVAENGMVVDGHHLRIDVVVARKKKDKNKSVFVGGLPFDVEDEDLWSAFQDCGEIEDVRVVRDNVISMGKGFGYVNFKSVASVELALKLDGSEIKNHKINVQRCLNKKKSFGKKASLTVKKKSDKAKEPNSKEGKELSNGDFQGRTAEQKKKKKKSKKSADTLRRNKIKKILGSSPKEMKKNKLKAPK